MTRVPPGVRVLRRGWLVRGVTVPAAMVTTDSSHGDDGGEMDGGDGGTWEEGVDESDRVCVVGGGL